MRQSRLSAHSLHHMSSQPTNTRNSQAQVFEFSLGQVRRLRPKTCRVRRERRHKGGAVAACSRIGSCGFCLRRFLVWSGSDNMVGVTLYTFSQTRVCNKHGTILVFETVVLFLIIENFGMQSCCITKCRGGRKRGTGLVTILHQENPVFSFHTFSYFFLLFYK